ncbi:GLPGLI family protein [Amniculibacterium aquaticum]|uniref:GLPGLI family protein n=1 Tax=Amniculibacterium aquaticum TaxID=2479858 RepID=UPI000F5B010D|nr:GLPGLI family protein [Amniculibacterium aquaticum]
MMKFSILFILLFLSTHNFKAQNNSNIANLRVVYEYKVIDSIHNNHKNVEFTLLLNNNYSIFVNADAYSYYNSSYMPELGSINRVPPSEKYSVYKKNGKIYSFIPILYEMYYFEEPQLEWELIKNQTKKFNTVTCQLAKTKNESGRVFYAWYTTDFPIPEGPSRFKGLPGLVLEVYSEDKVIQYTAIGMSKTTEIIDNVHYPISTHLDKKTFLEKREKCINNPNPCLPQSTLKVYFNGKPSKPQHFDGPLKINRKTLMD